MKKVIRLTEQDLYKIVKRVIKESDGSSVREEMETAFDNIINQYGLPEGTSFDEVSGIELKDILYNYDEMIHSFKVLKNLVLTHKENFEGKKKQSFLKNMFKKDDSEKVDDSHTKTPTTRIINNEIISLGRFYLNSPKIVPAEDKIEMFDSMIDILNEKIDYVKRLKQDFLPVLKGRKEHLSKRG